MRAMKCLFVSTALLLVTSVAGAQWFDQQSIKATVLIEKQDTSGVVPYGTGFLLWNYASPDSPIVVTCEHLLRRERIFVRFNADTSLISALSQGGARFVAVDGRTWEVVDHTLRTEVVLSHLGPEQFAVDSLLDIGAFVLNIGGAIRIGSQEMATKFADIVRIPASAVRKRHDISLGDELYFVGFPFGMGAGPRLEPLIRSGSVAWLSPESPEFLIDALSYGGNSGSPVFSKAIFGRKRGDASWDAPYLVAIVTSHISQDVAGVLTQPDPKKLAFQRQIVSSNLGLVRCVWIDDILRLVTKMRGPSEPFDSR